MLEVAGAIAAIAIPGAAIVITVIKTKASSASNGNVCSLHSGIETALDNLQKGQVVMQEDIKELLKRR